MLNSQRLALYEWVDANKEKKGKTKTIICNQMDYNTIRAQIAKREYAMYELLNTSSRDRKKIKVTII